jgi:hypothetical protein
MAVFRSHIQHTAFKEASAISEMVLVHRSLLFIISLRLGRSSHFLSTQTAQVGFNLQINRSIDYFSSSLPPYLFELQSFSFSIGNNIGKFPKSLESRLETVVYPLVSTFPSSFSSVLDVLLGLAGTTTLYRSTKS